MKNKWFVTNINKKYFLISGKKTFRCQIGSGGLKNPEKKIEGDKSTPIGNWRLVTIYYRSDRVLRPKFKNKNVLKIHKITKYCGWCDDVKSNFYNKYIKINHVKSSNINYEKFWRDDEAYNIIIVISHNVKPVIKNKGSAIFIHCSFPDDRNTAGCIAMQKKDLVYLIKNLRHNTSIKVKI